MGRRIDVPPHGGQARLAGGREERRCDMMTRTEIITRLCEVSAGLAELQDKARELGTELQTLMQEMQEGGEQ